MPEWTGTLADELARRYVAGWAANAFHAAMMDRARGELMSRPAMPTLTLEDMIGLIPAPLDLNDLGDESEGATPEMLALVRDAQASSERFRRTMQRSLDAMTDEERLDFQERVRPVTPTPEQLEHDFPEPQKAADGRILSVAEPIDGIGAVADWARRLDAECEARVVRWEHWTGEAHSIIPLERQLLHSPRGKQVEVPVEAHELWRFGFDKSDRLVIRRQGYIAGRNEQFWRLNALHVWSDDRVDRFEFDGDVRHVGDHDVPELTRAGVNDGQVAWLEQFRPDEYTNGRDNIAARAEYDYDDAGRVARICCNSLNGKRLAGFLGVLNYQSSDTTAAAEVSWSTRGTLDRIELVEGSRGDGRTMLYRRRRPDEPGINELLRVIEDAIVDGVPTAIADDIAKRPAAPPIWCIELMYDFDNATAWPTTWVGTVADRDDSDDVTWNFAEWAYEVAADPPIPPDLEPVILRVEEILHESDSWWRFRKMLCSASRRLLEGPWPESVSRSDDFVVTAVDIELGDFERNLKETIGVDRVRALKRAGKLG